MTDPSGGQAELTARRRGRRARGLAPTPGRVAKRRERSRAAALLQDYHCQLVVLVIALELFHVPVIDDKKQMFWAHRPRLDLGAQGSENSPQEGGPKRILSFGFKNLCLL